MVSSAALRSPELTAARNLAVEAELYRIVDNFSREKLDVVVLKGAPLMRRLGEPISARALADNDLLVRRASLEAAEATLRGLGYRPTRPLRLSVSAGTGQHAMVRITPFLRHVVDLHWEAFHAPFRHVSPSLVWDHTELTVLGDRQLRVLDRPLTLIHIAAHFVWHAMGQVRLLRTIGRAWEAWEDMVDVGDLRRLAIRTGTLPSLEYSVGAAHELGLARTRLPQTTLRARLVSEILPPAELLRERPVPDYERMAVALLLVSARRAATHAFRLAVPRAAEAAILAHDTSVSAVARTYLFRPFHAARRLNEYRHELARLRDEADQEAWRRETVAPS